MFIRLLLTAVYFTATVAVLTYGSWALGILPMPEAGFLGIGIGLLVVADRVYRGHP